MLAIHYATSEDFRVDIVELLLSREANPDVLNKDGFAAIHLVIKRSVNGYVNGKL